MPLYVKEGEGSLESALKRLLHNKNKLGDRYDLQ